MVEVYIFGVTEQFIAIFGKIFNKATKNIFSLILLRKKMMPRAIKENETLNNKKKNTFSDVLVNKLLKMIHS